MNKIIGKLFRIIRINIFEAHWFCFLYFYFTVKYVIFCTYLLSAKTKLVYMPLKIKCKQKNIRTNWVCVSKIAKSCFDILFCCFWFFSPFFSIFADIKTMFFPSPPITAIVNSNLLFHFPPAFFHLNIDVFKLNMQTFTHATINYCDYLMFYMPCVCVHSA